MTPLEKKLSEIPLRTLPPEWESEILATAKRTERVKPFAFWFPAWRNLLWSHPTAWAAIAAVWIVILTLNWSGPHGSELLVSTSSLKKTDAELIAELAALRARNALIAEWLYEEPTPLPRYKL